MYEADRYAEKNKKVDLRTIPERIKKVIIHDESIIQARMSTCQDCEHFIKATTTCKKCGCFMKVKTKLATASCPVGKWGKEYEFIKNKDVVTAT